MLLRTLTLMLLPVFAFSQVKEIHKADELFEGKQYYEASTIYHKILLEDKDNFKAKDTYSYLYLLLQVAECQRMLGSKASRDDYQLLLYEFSELRSLLDKRDFRIYYLVGEAYKNLEDYLPAVEWYAEAFDRMDSIPGRFRIGFAFSLMQVKRYGHALQLLQSIENKELYEPDYSTLFATCEKISTPQISTTLGINDTLRIDLFYDNCYTDYQFKFIFVRKKAGYEFISYTGKNPECKPTFEIYKKIISDSMYAEVINFEKELLNFTLNIGMTCSNSGVFSIKTKKQELSLNTISCDYQIGYRLRKMFACLPFW